MSIPEDESLYLFLSSDVAKLIHDNGMSLEDLLQKAGASDLEKVPDPARKPGQRDAMMIFVGSAIVVASATPLIVRLVEILANRPIVTNRKELSPALDGAGNSIKDAQGDAVMRWTETEVVDRGQRPRETTANVKVGRRGIEIGVGG